MILFTYPMAIVIEGALNAMRMMPTSTIAVVERSGLARVASVLTTFLAETSRIRQ